MPGTVLSLPEFPPLLPCNVCTQEIALKNVFRKHSDTGSWLPLERDIFLAKYMGEPKSPFVVLDEYTGLISAHGYLNKRFVKEEIFNQDTLKKLGFDIKDDQLLSQHTFEQAIVILSDIAKNIKEKNITTRKNRGRVLEVLAAGTRALVDSNKGKAYEPAAKESMAASVDGGEPKNEKLPRKSKRTKVRQNEIFGGPLYLKTSEANNLYRDISDLYYHYMENRNKFSANFPAIIRMSLRMLAEVAANEDGQAISKYLQSNYKEAAKTFDRDTKTTLSNYNIRENTITQLIQTGAHAYSSSNNIEQTVAISIALGAIVTLTHGKV